MFGVFCVNNVVGVRIKSVVVFVEIDINGLLLIIVNILVMKVVSILWVRFFLCILESIEFSIFLVELIICFYVFFMKE